MSTVEESQVRVITYHSDWPVLYEHEAQRLRAILSGIAVDVQHFGSTAVPGLDAKPNVDILVGVPAGASLATEQIDALTQHGYDSFTDFPPGADEAKAPRDGEIWPGRPGKSRAESPFPRSENVNE